MKIIIALLIFSGIIIFHEFGHFLLARLNGVKVNEFCLGLGPTIFRIKGKKTDFCLKLLPFGGACMMEGEDSLSDSPEGFNNKNVWQRISIVLAGPFFNIILAYVLAVILVSLAGFRPAVVGDVSEGYAAQAAGLQSGDTLIKLGNYRLHYFNEISLYTFFHPGEDIPVVYERDGKKYSTTLTPKQDETGRYLIGVISSPGMVKPGAVEALKYGFYEIKYQIYMVVQSLRALVRGIVPVTEMSGPVGIVDTIGEVYEESKDDGVFYIFINMISIATLLTANLGVMNLLPIPALDGGRLLIYLIEIIRGKRLKEEIEGYINLIGFGLLMLLMVFIMFNDITRLLK